MTEPHLNLPPTDDEPARTWADLFRRPYALPPEELLARHGRAHAAGKLCGEDWTYVRGYAEEILRAKIEEVAPHVLNPGFEDAQYRTAAPTAVPNR